MISKNYILLLILIYFNIFNYTMCIVDTKNVIEKFKPVVVADKTFPKINNAVQDTSTETTLFGQVLGGANVETGHSVLSNIEKIKELADILEALTDKLIPLIMDNQPVAGPTVNRANDVDILGGSLRNGGNNIRSLHLFRALTNDD